MRAAAIGEASDLELGERDMGDLEGLDQEGLLNRSFKGPHSLPAPLSTVKNSGYSKDWMQWHYW